MGDRSLVITEEFSLHAFKDSSHSAPLRIFVFNLVPPFLSLGWHTPAWCTSPRAPTRSGGFQAAASAFLNILGPLCQTPFQRTLASDTDALQQSPIRSQ